MSYRKLWNRDSYRYRDGQRAGRLGFDSWQKKDFSFLHSVQTGSGSHPASNKWVPGTLSPEVKRPEREADHSPPSNVEVKKGGAIPPLPHTSSWRDAYLIKHRYNFAFFRVIIKLCSSLLFFTNKSS
jgi:hypothetical protein